MHRYNFHFVRRFRGFFAVPELSFDFVQFLCMRFSWRLLLVSPLARHDNVIVGLLIVSGLPVWLPFCPVSFFCGCRRAFVPFAAFRAFLGLFRGCMLSFHHIPVISCRQYIRVTLIFALFRVFLPLVGCYALNGLQAVLGLFSRLWRCCRFWIAKKFCSDQLKMFSMFSKSRVYGLSIRTNTS